MGIIRIILIVLLIYYLIRFLDKYLIPKLFGKSDDVRTGKRKDHDDDDDFVDYEEVE